VRPRGLLIALTVVLLVAGCTGSPGGGGDRAGGDPPSAKVVTAAPGTRLTLVADADPVASSVSTSRALFRTAQVVVLAPEGDPAGTLLGATAAVGLGVPLLVEPKAADPRADTVAAELARLGARTVLTVGGVSAPSQQGRTTDRANTPKIVRIPAEPGAVEAATRLHLGAEKAVAAGQEPGAVAALDPGKLAALQPVDAKSSTSAGNGRRGEVPDVPRSHPLSGTLVLATGSPESVAGIATARAAGARVQVTNGLTDPRGSADVVHALSRDDVKTVIALGADLAGVNGLDWKSDTAATGAELPGGGQLLFPGRMLVALYGHPGSAALGVLGEQGIDASIQRAREHAARYAPLVDTTVVPAFEIIATVASSAPGPDGNYSAESDPEELRPWVEAAGAAGLYVVLDLQPGRTDFLTQAQQYSSLLELPYVGLALDPEWRLGPSQVHLSQVGSVGIDEVNRLVTWLADLTREKALPQKLLVLHQFKLAMLPGRAGLDTSRDELAVLIHADGQGSQAQKQGTWRALHANAPAGVSWGWKNFYDEDHPMLTPDQTIAQVIPRPNLISYQ
jgi:hypothetical protein